MSLGKVMKTFIFRPFPPHSLAHALHDIIEEEEVLMHQTAHPHQAATGMFWLHLKCETLLTIIFYTVHR